MSVIHWQWSSVIDTWCTLLQFSHWSICADILRWHVHGTAAELHLTFALRQFEGALNWQPRLIAPLHPPCSRLILALPRMSASLPLPTTSQANSYSNSPAAIEPISRGSLSVLVSLDAVEPPPGLVGSQSNVDQLASPADFSATLSKLCRTKSFVALMEEPTVSTEADGDAEFHNHAIVTREAFFESTRFFTDAVPAAVDSATIQSAPDTHTSVALEIEPGPAATDSGALGRNVGSSTDQAANCNDAPVVDANAEFSESHIEKVVETLASLKFAIDERDAKEIEIELSLVLALNSSSQLAIDLICEAQAVLVALSSELASEPSERMVKAEDLFGEESPEQVAQQTATELRDAELSTSDATNETARSFDAFVEAAAHRFVAEDSTALSAPTTDPEEEAALLRAQVVAASRIIGSRRLQNRVAAKQRRASLRDDIGGHGPTPHGHLDGVSAPLSDADLWTFKEAASLGPRGWQRRIQLQRQLQQQQENCKCTIS